MGSRRDHQRLLQVKAAGAVSLWCYVVLPWRWRQPGPLTNPIVVAMLTMSLAPARTNNLILLFMLIDRFAGVDRGNPDNLIAKPNLRTLRDT